MKNVGRGGARFPFLLGELGLLDRMIEKPEDFVSKFNEAGFKLFWKKEKNQLPG